DVELARADVHGVHARGAALQQAVGETARGGAHVEADAAGHLHLEGVERVDELLAAPAHERCTPLDLDARFPGDEGARLVDALDEQTVDTAARHGLGHALHYRRPPRRDRIRNSRTIPARNPPM